MKKLSLLFFFIALPCYAFAVGSQCDPSLPGWGECDIVADPSWVSSNVSTIYSVAGGTYNAPFQANSTGTRYVLDGDIVADATAIEITGNYIVIDLNGHKITYNETSSGSGILLTTTYNNHHIFIHNGTIEQGSANGEGNTYGFGCNPIAATESVSIDSGLCDRVEYTDGNATCVGFVEDYNVDVLSSYDVHLANLWLKYSGKDVRGIVLTRENAIVEQCTISDNYGFGTIKHRDDSIWAIAPAISGGGAGEGWLIRNNTLNNIRHCGISVGAGGVIDSNAINLRSIDTNSVALSGNNATISNNVVTGRGVHPLGIYLGWGTQGTVAENNTIDVMSTYIGREYASGFLDNKTATYTSLNAAGFRSHFGAEDVVFRSNVVNATGSGNYTGQWAITGETAYIKSEARAVNVGLYNENDSLRVYNNTINAMDIDGGGETVGIAITASMGSDADLLFVYDNAVNANQNMLHIGTMYGASLGYPLIYRNSFNKVGSLSSYKTIKNNSNGYFAATARLVDNVYTGGASESDRLLFPSDTNDYLDIYIGTVDNGSFVYTSRISDENNTSSVEVITNYDPAITLSYRDILSDPDPEDPDPTPTTTGPVPSFGGMLLSTGGRILVFQ